MSPQRRSARQTVWVVVGASAASILFTCIVFGLLLKANSDARADDDNDRIERSIESCLGENREQEGDRVFGREQVPQMATNLFGQTPEEVEEILARPGTEVYNDFIDEQNPFRQCSAECIEAYLDAEIEDCPPAEDVEGNPPLTRA